MQPECGKRQRYIAESEHTVVTLGWVTDALVAVTRPCWPNAMTAITVAEEVLQQK